MPGEQLVHRGGPAGIPGADLGVEGVHALPAAGVPETPHRVVGAARHWRGTARLSVGWSGDLGVIDELVAPVCSSWTHEGDDALEVVY